MITRITNFLRWIDYLLSGPEPPPKACEYRRPARITYIRHGERKRVWRTRAA